MFLALLITVVYTFFVWLVFFKMKWIKFNIAWGLVTGFVGLHVLLIFMIGLRFLTPLSTDAKVIQHTIQLTPRLTEPTLVTAVLVESNVPVKKGQPLIQFDEKPYRLKVNAAQAQLAEAEQHVLQLKSQWQAATHIAEEARAKLELAKDANRLAETVWKDDHAAISQLKLDQTRQAMLADEAALQAALANQTTAHLAYTAEIDGENTTVARYKADLALAQYYLDNTTLVAPEDGYVINLQVRPGMVAGMYRIGAIASFVCDADRYLLATYYQEHLKFVKVGQPVEVALDLYPGQIFPGRVQSIWRANADGQLLPSGDLPALSPPPKEAPQDRFAVQISLDNEDQSLFPIGAQGAAAIYTEWGGFAALRRIGIRGRTWLNWLYPMPF